MTKHLKKGVFPEAKKGTSGSYSPGLQVGEIVFVSGQGPIGTTPEEIIGAEIAEQTVVTLQNVAGVLRQAGRGGRESVASRVWK